MLAHPSHGQAQHPSVPFHGCTLFPRDHCHLFLFHIPLTSIKVKTIQLILNTIGQTAWTIGPLKKYMHWPACVASVNFSCQLINNIFPVLIWCILALLTINECLRLILMVNCTGLMKILTQNKGKLYSLYICVCVCMHVYKAKYLDRPNFLYLASHLPGPNLHCSHHYLQHNSK